MDDNSHGHILTLQARRWVESHAGELVATLGSVIIMVPSFFSGSNPKDYLDHPWWWWTCALLSAIFLIGAFALKARVSPVCRQSGNHIHRMEKCGDFGHRSAGRSGRSVSTHFSAFFQRSSTWSEETSTPTEWAPCAARRGGDSGPPARQRLNGRGSLGPAEPVRLDRSIQGAPGRLPAPVRKVPPSA